MLYGFYTFKALDDEVFDGIVGNGWCSMRSFIHKVSRLERQTESVQYLTECSVITLAALFKVSGEDQRFCCHDNSVCVLQNICILQSVFIIYYFKAIAEVTEVVVFKGGVLWKVKLS